ncbi:hypothetical protein [Tenacibaculum mesophilum]|uniref:hypothetical protein n=1 Tax=Tenacibaculum mesophilum TaxID=104268 RepID=UPI003F5ED731
MAGGDNFYAYVHDSNSYVDVLGLAGQRWMSKTKSDGTPYRKPGPKAKGTGDHNAKIDEIIVREKAKPGIEYIGGGSKTEVIIDTTGGLKDTRRMDASFKRADGSVYHINVGRSLADGKTGIIREIEALKDVLDVGEDSDYRSKVKTSCN